MLQIDNTIISLNIFEEYFECKLNACKGECCVEGDAGAPLEPNEVETIKALLPLIWDDLSEKSKEVIKKQGVSYIDEDGEAVTSIVNGAECVFAYFDKNDICKCAIEKAFYEGKTYFKKPISCHLYPIRVARHNDFIAVNHHKWSVCECAYKQGKSNKTLLYQYLREPLIRKFGEDWYNELETAATELINT